MICVLLFAALPSRADGQPISIAVGTVIQDIVPHSASTFAEHVVVRALHRGLVQYEADGRIGPGLAESWDVSSNGRIYMFSLNPDLTWSDGRSLSAADVVAGIKRALDPNRPSPFVAKLFSIVNAEEYQAGILKERDVLGVAAPDTQTIVFTLERQAVDFLEILTHPVAMPVPATDPDALSDGLLTSGAYRVKHRRNNGAIELTPNSEGPELTVLPTGSVAEAWSRALESPAFVTAALPILTVPSVGDRADLIKVDGGAVLYAYAVNTARKPFDTIEVRHALAMAIQRTTLLEELTISGTEPADHYVTPSVMGLLRSYKAPFAPLTIEEREAVAAALLSEQGFGRSRPLNVQLRIPAGDVHQTIAQMAATMWAAAGIETEIVEASLPEHWQALAAGDFDVAFVSWPGRRDTPRGILEPLSRAGGPWNFPRYDFADFTERLNRANAYDRKEARIRFYREAEKALIEDQALLALFFYQPLVLVSPDIQGWVANISGHHPLRALSLPKDNSRINLIKPTLPQAVPSFGEDP